MSRFSSAVALSILGFCFAHGCSTKEEDDDDDLPTTTGADTNTNSGGTGGTSSGAQSATSGGGSGGSGGTSSSTDGEVPIGEACPEHANLGTCGKGAESAKPKPVNMLIVLDKSGSMDHEANGVQKWAAMKDALGLALEEVADNINFGLELYPTPELESDVIDKDACGEAGNCCEMPSNMVMNVPVQSGGDAVDLIVDKLNNTDPGGGTPTARALERALDYFTQGEGASLDGDKFVLLATDGGPNCNSDLQCGADLCTYNLDGMRDCSSFADGNCCEASSQAGGGDGCVDSYNVVDRINDLKDVGIETFVVGIPGTEAYSDFLDEFAEAGGRAVSGTDFSYYRVDDVADLTDVFREITVQLVTSCDLEIPESTSTLPPKVVVDCEIIPRFQNGAGGASEQTTNWEWEAGSETITLVGDACERVSQGVDRIDVVVDCDIPE
ncbi:MAG TPA: vWA domain-containing protein [Polyangiaceae bacterium]|nr:vWA domain-containing protein [Polyangiaceae bacterium]